MEEDRMDLANTPDPLGEKIRQEVYVGQEFKSWAELYRLLGFKKFSGGRQKAKAQKKILQYVSVEATSGRKFRITEIYEVPHLEVSRRGQSGKYSSLIKPTLLFSMLSEDKMQGIYTHDQIAEKTGMVNRYFPEYYRWYESIQKSYVKLSVKRVDSFVRACRGVFKPSIEAVLRRLMIEGAIVCYEMFRISDDGGRTYHLSSDFEANCLIESENEVRHEVPYQQWQIVFNDAIRDEFYRLVRERFREKTGIEIDRYQPVFKIKIVDKDKAREIASADQKEFSESRCLLNARFKERLLFKEEKDLSKNETTEKERVEEYEKNIKSLLLIGDTDWRSKHKLLPEGEKRFLMDEDSVQMWEQLVSLLIDLDSTILP